MLTIVAEDGNDVILINAGVFLHDVGRGSALFHIGKDLLLIVPRDLLVRDNDGHKDSVCLCAGTDKALHFQTERAGAVLKGSLIMAIFFHASGPAA